MGEGTEADAPPVYGGRRRARGVLARTSERAATPEQGAGDAAPNVPDAIRYFPSTGQVPVIHAGSPSGEPGAAAESTLDRPSLGAPADADIRVADAQGRPASTTLLDEDTSPRVGEPVAWHLEVPPADASGGPRPAAHDVTDGDRREPAHAAPPPVAAPSAPARITIDGSAMARAAERSAVEPAHAEPRRAAMIEPLREWAAERTGLGALEHTVTGPISTASATPPATAAAAAGGTSAAIAPAPASAPDDGGHDRSATPISTLVAHEPAPASGAPATDAAATLDPKPAATRARTPAAPRRTALAALRAAVATPALWIGVAGFALCLLGAWLPSFSRLEAITIESATRDWDGMWQLITSGHAANAVWMWFSHVWIGAFGLSELSLRFVPSLAAGATVAATVALGSRLASVRAGVFAGVAALALPRLSLQGTEATSIAAAVTLGTWATVALTWAVGADDPIPRFDVPRRLVSHRNRERRRAAVWRHVGRWSVVFALLAAATWVFAPLALLALAHPVFLMVAGARRGALRGSTIASLAAVASATPLVVAIAQHGWRVDERAGAAGADAWQWFVAPALTGLFWVIPLAAVLAITLVIGLVRVRRIVRAVGDTGLWLGATLLAVPAAWLLALELLAPGSFAPEYLAMSVPALALLVGIVIATSPMWLTVVLTAVVALSSLVPVGLQKLPTSRGSDDRATAAYIADRSSPGDGIIFSQAASGDTSGRVMMSSYPSAFAGLRDVTLARSGAASGTLWDTTVDIAVVPDRLDALDRVWVVRPADQPLTTSTPEYAVYAAAGFASIRSAEFGGFVVYELVRTEAFGLGPDGRPPQPDELPALPTPIPTAYDQASAPPTETAPPDAPTTPPPAPVATPGQPAPTPTETP